MIPDNVDARLERAGKKGHRYVKRSFDRRKDRIRKRWLATASKLLQEFSYYLRERMGCEL